MTEPTEDLTDDDAAEHGPISDEALDEDLLPGILSIVQGLAAYPLAEKLEITPPRILASIRRCLDRIEAELVLEETVVEGIAAGRAKAKTVLGAIAARQQAGSSSS